MQNDTTYGVGRKAKKFERPGRTAKCHAIHLFTHSAIQDLFESQSDPSGPKVGYRPPFLHVLPEVC